MGNIGWTGIIIIAVLVVILLEKENLEHNGRFGQRH